MIKVIIIAVSGSTCSGKTTLVKHLNQILINSLILHQDDFAPPEEKIPLHDIYKVPDWDSVDGAIDWQRQRDTLHYLREFGRFPSSHSSHDSFNEQIAVPISNSLKQDWIEKFHELQTIRNGEGEMVFVLADGFLMLSDEESVKEFDVRLFVREAEETVKRRRVERSGYHTAVESDPEGTMWRDPPGYWENIVWPAYVSAHVPLILNGDIQKGQFDSNKIEGVEIIEASQLNMNEMVEKACCLIFDRVKSGLSAKNWKKP